MTVSWLEAKAIAQVLLSTAGDLIIDVRTKPAYPVLCSSRELAILIDEDSQRDRSVALGRVAQGSRHESDMVERRVIPPQCPFFFSPRRHTRK